MDLIYALLVGALAGWITGKLTRGQGFGLLGNIVIGVVGAVVGNLLLRILGFNHSGGLVSSVITAVFGAFVLIAVLRAVLVKQKRGR